MHVIMNFACYFHPTWLVRNVTSVIYLVFIVKYPMYLIMFNTLFDNNMNTGTPNRLCVGCVCHGVVKGGGWW